MIILDNFCFNMHRIVRLKNCQINNIYNINRIIQIVLNNF